MYTKAFIDSFSLEFDLIMFRKVEFDQIIHILLMRVIRSNLTQGRGISSAHPASDYICKINKIILVKS